MMATDGLVLALMETGGDPIAFIEGSGLETPDWVWGLQAWFGPLATFNAAARMGREQRLLDATHDAGAIPAVYAAYWDSEAISDGIDAKDFLVCLAEAGWSLRRTEAQR